MKYSLPLILLLFLVIPAKAQNVGGHSFNISFDRNSDVRLHKNAFDELEGSPFLNEEWAKGIVMLRTGAKTNALDLKYSSYTNQLLFKQGGQILAATPKDFKGFTLNLENGIASFKKGYKSPEHDISPGLVLEVIHDGTIKLLAHHNNTIRELRSDPMTGEVTKKFVKRTNYFLVDKSGNFHNIKHHEDDILEVLESHSENLREYANSKNLDFDDEKDLANILAHYETMVNNTH